MSGWLITALAGLGGILLGVCSDMLGEEVRARLDRIPQALIRLAALRLPEEIRGEKAREWLGELHEVLHGAEAVPVTRLVKGVGFSGGIFFSTPRLAKAMGFEEEESPKEPRETSLQERQDRHAVMSRHEFLIEIGGVSKEVSPAEIEAKVTTILEGMKQKGWTSGYSLSISEVEVKGSREIADGPPYWRVTNIQKG